MKTLVQVRQLVKRFNGRTVLDQVSLDIEGGAVTAVIGPNGAGKTTLNKCILGLVRPDSGSIFFDGYDTRNTIAYRARIGYMPQQARFPESFTGRDVLSLLSDLRTAQIKRDATLVERFQLEPFLDRPVRVLSGGQRQRINATAAFLFRPDLLVLDEPTSGLDPIASGQLKDRIAEVRDEGRAVIITSHVLSEVEQLADRIVFLLDGIIAWTGATEQLLRETGCTTLERAIATIMQQSQPNDRRAQR